jgi:hypothetical protein
MDATVKPTPQHPFLSWWLYVSCGTTREERVRRLGECPGELRGRVEERVRRFFEERARAAR